MKAHKIEEEEMKISNRVVRLETVIEHIEYMLTLMDKRFETLTEKTKDGVKEVNRKIDSNIGRLESKVDTNFKWLMGMMITLFVLNGFVPVITKAITELISR